MHDNCVFLIVILTFQIQPIINGENATKTIPWVAAIKMSISGRKGDKRFQSSFVTDAHLLATAHSFCHKLIKNCTAAVQVIMRSNNRTAIGHFLYFINWALDQAIVVEILLYV